MHRLTLRTALAATALAAAALGSATVATATPTGPCEEVTYVGVCGSIRDQDRTPPQRGMAEVILPEVAGNPVAIG